MRLITPLATSLQPACSRTTAEFGVSFAAAVARALVSAACATSDPEGQRVIINHESAEPPQARPPTTPPHDLDKLLGQKERSGARGQVSF